MEKQEFDQLAQLLFSADFDSVKVGLMAIQGLLTPADILKNVSFLHNDTEWSNVLNHTVWKNAAKFILTFGTRDEYIGISLSFNNWDGQELFHSKKTYALLIITHRKKGDYINHKHWELSSFALNLRYYIDNLQYSQIAESDDLMADATGNCLYEILNTIFCDSLVVKPIGVNAK